jgi:hypothetical protein
MTAWLKQPGHSSNTMKKALVTLIAAALAVSIPSVFAHRGGQMKAAADSQADSAPGGGDMQGKGKGKGKGDGKGKGKGGPDRDGKGSKGGMPDQK